MQIINYYVSILLLKTINIWLKAIMSYFSLEKVCLWPKNSTSGTLSQRNNGKCRQKSECKDIQHGVIYNS